MDIFDITAKEVNRDKLGEKVKDGQVVQITRMVTVVYNVYISEVLDGTDETDITLKALLEDEEGNTVNSVNLEYSGNVDIVDNSIISVDIV